MIGIAKGSEGVDVNLEYTGEFAIPGSSPGIIWLEHVSRYEFASEFTRSASVLDVACGSGYGTNLLARRGARSAVGGDLSPTAIRHARAHFSGQNVSFIRLSASHLPFRDAQFDVVVSFETIEHLGLRDLFLGECARVLRKDGLMICSTPFRAAWAPPWARPSNPFHVHEFTIEEFHDLMSRHFGTVDLSGQHYIGIAGVAIHYLRYFLDRVSGGNLRMLSPARQSDHVPDTRLVGAGRSSFPRYEVHARGGQFAKFPLYLVAKAASPRQ